MDRKEANEILSNLDKTANQIEKLGTSGVIKPETAKKICHELDAFADKFQVAAFGAQNLQQHQAKVLKRDSDEPWMDTFENPNEPLKTDADETFMHMVDKSFNSDAIDTFDADRTNTVTDRKEHDVRDVSEHSNGTKPQPSWTGGKGGKSTKQGATRPRAAGEKTWA